MLRRILLKLSGEVLGGNAGQGLNPEVLLAVARDVKAAVDLGASVAIVIGAGNIFRGETLSGAAEIAGMRRVTADHIGMLGTIINGLAFRDALDHIGAPTVAYSPGGIAGVTEAYASRAVIGAMDAGKVAVLAGGTGNPFFTTDTAACLRGVEIEADVVLKATKVDGVYDRDPKTDEEAVRFDRLTFQQAIQRDLKVMDLAALALCRDHDMPVIVYDMNQADALTKIVRGDKVGTRIEVEK